MYDDIFIVLKQVCMCDMKMDAKSQNAKGPGSDRLISCISAVMILIISMKELKALDALMFVIPTFPR